MRNIYLDNAAGTPIDPRVVRAMHPAEMLPGNPSAFNAAGRIAQGELDRARTGVAAFLGAHPSEIVFCASGSEANNLAILGVGALQGSPRAAVSTPIEHHSVLAPFLRLQKSGWRVKRIGVDRFGVITVDDVRKLLTKEVAIISIMYANNEIGSIQPIRTIGRMIHQWRKEHRSKWPLFHVDACQATAYLPMNVQNLYTDLLTINASKVHGPRGVAVLFVRRGTPIAPLVLGGDQEFGRRAGTEFVAGAVGLSVALSLLRHEDAAKVAALRDYGIEQLLREVPGAKLNGPTGDMRLHNNIHISIPGVTSEEVLVALDAHNISAGSGSACTAHRVEVSHVLRVIGVPRKYLAGALRISLSRMNTKKDVDALVRVLPGIVRNIQRRNLKQR